MTYRTVRSTSTAEGCATAIVAFIITTAFGFAIDLLGAWMVMAGLHGMHLKVGFWPCFLILCGISTAVAGSASGKSSRS
jgi:hypothetical protein